MRNLVATILTILVALCISAFAQGPAGRAPGTPPVPPGGPPIKQATQGRLAVALATRLGLGENLTEPRAIGLLATHRIVPETGWNRQGPATDLFLVEIQKTIQLLLTEIARDLGIPVPATLSLMISTPGQLGGQTLRPAQERGASRVGSTPPVADESRPGETAQASIETPHPYPIGDEQLPVVWSYRLRVPAARFIRVHFARLELAAPHYIRVLDGYGQERWKLGGSNLQTGDVWSTAVEGDTAIIVIQADNATPGWGFKIDRYGYGTR